jgi:hypothetical protein
MEGGTGMFVLGENIAFSIAVPISQMNPHSGAWNAEQILRVLTPVRWIMDVLINSSGLTVVVNPLPVYVFVLEAKCWMAYGTHDVIFISSASHIAIKYTIT